MQVIMRLLGHLEGVSPATYPRDTYGTVNKVTLKTGLGPLLFCIAHKDADPTPSASVTGAAAAASNADDTADSQAAGAAGAQANSLAMPLGGGTGAAASRERRREKADRMDVAAKGTYRGRTRVGPLWLSTVCYGDS
jgi:hypothetical protein